MKRDESGQALAEFGLMAPLLVLMLGGILYCGGVVIARENLAMAARGAARRMALDATLQGLQNGNARAGNAQAAMKQALPGATNVQANGVSWAGMSTGNGGQQIDSHTVLYAQTGSIHIGKTSYKCGVGCLLYGVTAHKDLSHDLAPFAQLVSSFGGKLSQIATLDIISVMPGDLPPRGPGNASVLGLNSWITKIVNSNDKNL